MDFNNFECSSEELGFTYIQTVNHGKTSVSHFDKDFFSIIYVLEGEADYIIEGKVIHITPNDVLIVGNNEKHYSRVMENSECRYILLMINIDFFIKNNCAEFDDMVFNRTLGNNNIIDSEKVLNSNIADIFTRLNKYVAESPVCMSVVNSVIIELIYNLNKQVTKSKNNKLKKDKVKNIIEFINNNLTEELTLETIASKFFLTKQHLCKIFKAGTGFTINKYISYKRIVVVRELYLKGATLSEACSAAGFKDYSSFYRAYYKIMDESPRQGLSKISS